MLRSSTAAILVQGFYLQGSLRIAPEPADEQSCTICASHTVTTAIFPPRRGWKGARMTASLAAPLRRRASLRSLLVSQQSVDRLGRHRQYQGSDINKIHLPQDMRSIFGGFWSRISAFIGLGSILQPGALLPCVRHARLLATPPRLLDLPSKDYDPRSTTMRPRLG